MKFYLVDGYIKFLTHTVETDRMKRIIDPDTKEVTYEVGGVTSRAFYSIEDKNAYLQRLEEAQENTPYEIEPRVTEHEAPSQELLDRVEGKKFNTIAEAQAFIDSGTLPKEQRLQQELTETQLALTEIYELMLGGVDIG